MSNRYSRIPFFGATESKPSSLSLSKLFGTDDLSGTIAADASGKK
jgi:hypothetical protein